MSFDFRHWLALACLLPALVFFAMSHDMPVFSDPERIARLNLHEEGTDYRLKTERFNQAVKEELTPKLKLEERALCFLALAFLSLQLPSSRRPAVSGRRVVCLGAGALLAFPILVIDQSIRDFNRGLYPVWADSLGPYWFVAVIVDLVLLMALVPFLYRACLGLQGAGRVFKGLAGILGLTCLALAVIGLLQWDYVALASAGLFTLFFSWFLLGTQTRR